MFPNWLTNTHIWRYKYRKLFYCFIVRYVFEIDIVAWFTWKGEIIAMRMLFNGNNGYHHFIMPKILKIFLFNFPNWSCLREHCAYPHFPMWKNHECCLTLNIFSPWVSGLAHHRHAFCLWEQSDANTQTLSGPLTLIRSLRCLEGQMVFVAISAPGLTPFTHSRLTGIGLWSIDPPKQKNPHLITEICTYIYIWSL